jgi:hypothetical protein
MFVWRSITMVRKTVEAIEALLPGNVDKDQIKAG